MTFLGFYCSASTGRVMVAVEEFAGRVGRERYAAHYSTGRLRDLAGAIKGSRHSDLWRQFHLVVTALSGEAAGEPIRQQLALPALGSFFWNPTSTAALNDIDLTNFDLLEALRHLAFTRQGKVLRPVDYKNLGAEELGGVYESLLALTPQISADGARVTFAEFAGNERKTSGSYYTPIKLLDKGAGPFWNASATPCHRFRVLLEFGRKPACIELVSAIDVLFVGRLFRSGSSKELFVIRPISLQLRFGLHMAGSALSTGHEPALMGARSPVDPSKIAPYASVTARLFVADQAKPVIHVGTTLSRRYDQELAWRSSIVRLAVGTPD